MHTKVQNYIHDNSDHPAMLDKKTKEVLVPAEPPKTRLFGIKKGIGGGIWSWADV
jgi:hypothetical protein